MKLAAGNNNANLIMILLHPHLCSTKKHEGRYYFAKNTGVEVLKMGTVTDMPSSDLFVVQVMILGVLKNVLLIHCPQICL